VKWKAESKTWDNTYPSKRENSCTTCENYSAGLDKIGHSFWPIQMDFLTNIYFVQRIIHN